MDLNPPDPAVNPSLLFVTRDEELTELLCGQLSESGFQVILEPDGMRATGRVVREHFDLLLLDTAIQTVDGISLLRRARDTFLGPIVVLTPIRDELDEVIVLELGADDFVAKPVRSRALLARLRRRLRKRFANGQNGSTRIDVNGLKMDTASRTARLNDMPLHLTSSEFDLLWLLASRAGVTVTRHAIYEELLGTLYDGTDRTVDLRISRVRKKLGDDPHRPSRIKSVRGIGYLFAIDS